MAGSCNAHVQPVPLQGCPTALYTAPVTVGGQAFNLLVDTGSTTLGVASAACSNCSLASGYRPGTSAHDANSTVNATYYTGKSGWSGEVFTDSVDFADAPSVTMGFAAITQQTNFFQKNAQCAGSSQVIAQDGIVGMGRSPGALPGTDAFVDKLHDEGHDDTVTLALKDVGGDLWLGGYNPDSVSAPPQFVPLLTTSPSASSTGLATFYTFNVTSLQAKGGAGSTATQNLTMVADSGTSGFLLPTESYQALTAEITAQPGYTANFAPTFLASTVCAPTNTATTPAELDAALPAIDLVVTNTAGKAITLTLPATASYLQLGVSADGKRPYYCPNLQKGDVPIGLFGAAMMRSLVVIFDPARNQLGFAPSAEQGATVQP